MKMIKVLALCGLGIYGVKGLIDLSKFHFIDGVNILFHEAGHLFFGVFGEYVGIWGGTLLELFIPFGLAVAFLWKREWFASSVMFLWFGQVCVPVSVYIRDARVQVLPTIGGEIHDWGYILTHARLLQHEQTIGTVVFSFGACIMILSLIFGFYTVFADTKKT